jgi:pimeloyl-ACP methyl ester carboxylesterase
MQGMRLPPVQGPPPSIARDVRPGIAWSASLIVFLLLFLPLAGCVARPVAGPGEVPGATPGPAPATPAGPGQAGAGGGLLAGARPCPSATGFTCSTLTVPLDHAGKEPGTLGLQVAVADNEGAPRGVLVLLTGGPGQPGAPFVARLGGRLGPAVTSAYRLVMLDQRGTGAAALDCPALQAGVGSSDLLVPPAGSVEACAASLGPRRRFYGTAETVDDLDLLRVALGADRLTLDGVSYGSYVAARYALAHPDHVAALVLDSVVPHAGIDPLMPEVLRATGRVLREACTARGGCPSDPAADLAAVVGGPGDDVDLLDALVTLSIVNPSLAGVPEALGEARQGRTAKLDRIVAEAGAGQRSTTADQLSQGLHAAALCADLRMPWGGSAAPAADRAAALERAAAKLRPEEVWPFDRATAAANGLVRTCQRWPPTPGAPTPPDLDRDLPAVPVLLLAGDHDLSTPLDWARAEAARAPRGELVVVPGAGHSVQSRAQSDLGRRAVERFLTR